MGFSKLWVLTWIFLMYGMKKNLEKKEKEQKWNFDKTFLEKWFAKKNKLIL